MKNEKPTTEQPAIDDSEKVEAIEDVLNHCMSLINEVCVANFGEPRPIMLAVNIDGVPQNSRYTRATNCQPPSDALMLFELWDIANSKRPVVEVDRGPIEGGSKIITP